MGVTPIVRCGGPYGTVSELLFERKELIPALQLLLFNSRETSYKQTSARSEHRKQLRAS